MDKVFFDSYTDWLKVFSGKFEVAVPAQAENNFILEAFQRRHVIVHNGGRVSQQYLDRVPAEHADVPLGTVLQVDAAYLQKVADSLFVTGMSLICVAGFKLQKEAIDRQSIGGNATQALFQLLQAGRYEPVAELTKIHPSKTFTDAGAALRWTINGWLALKRLNRFKECRIAVEKWDTSTLEPMYKLAKLALLDQYEPAMKIVKAIRGTDQLEEKAWASWPLLQELRAYDLAQVAETDVSDTAKPSLS